MLILLIIIMFLRFNLTGRGPSQQSYNLNIDDNIWLYVALKPLF